MSYKEKYLKKITVTGTETYTYPASQNGGTGTVHYSQVVPIEVILDVDTMPFDKSVNHCNSNVNLLTGAVAATETAQIISIKENSQKVANTIVGGFFGLIRSEISQQTTELQKNAEAALIHLKEIVQSCIAKKSQMESDFRRISDRYIKIFDDLNRELVNRITELDRPSFAFSKEMTYQRIRSTDSDLVSTVTVYGKESSDLQSRISVSVAKKRALDVLQKSQEFLRQQNLLKQTIETSVQKDYKIATYCVPASYIETSGGSEEKLIYITDELKNAANDEYKKVLIRKFNENINASSAMDAATENRILNYLNKEIEQYITGNSDKKALRTAEVIRKMADLKQINYYNQR